MTGPDFAAELLDGAGSVRLLVRYPNWIGDAVMALPALEALPSLPGKVEIIVLAKPWVTDIIGLSGLSVECRLLEPPGSRRGFGAWRQLVGEIRDLSCRGAVLFPNSFGAALMAAASGIPLRGGYAAEWRSFLLTHPIARPQKRWPPKGQSGYYLNLVRGLGFKAQVSPIPRLRAIMGAAKDISLAVLAPGASYGPAKMWPAMNYINLGRELASLGKRIVILGSRAEDEVCRLVAEGIGKPAENLCGRTSLAEAARLMAGAGLVVGNDSGLAHLAAAAGTPTVVLFGSTDPEATASEAERVRVVAGGAECAPCFKRNCRRGDYVCFKDITVDRVLAVCRELLPYR